MNILKDIHEYSFRMLKNWINIQIISKISRNEDWIFKRIFKVRMNMHMNIYLNIQRDLKYHEYLFEYSLMARITRVRYIQRHLKW